MGRPSAIVYVDGFNLYKGQLQSRPENKWVDLVALFDDFLSGYDVALVKYFTARIKGRLNPSDPTAPDRQSAYLRALGSLDRIEMFDDSIFSIHHGRAREFVDGKEVPPLTYHNVYKVQEKGSDVKLATNLLLDAMDRKADAFIVVSSDSDLAYPIRIVKERFGARVGIVYPRDEKTKLFAAAGVDFEIYLHPSHVALHQLPPTIHPPGARMITRPSAWTKSKTPPGRGLEPGP